MEVRGHETVLLNEAVLGLTLAPGALVVDATGGVGGHSARILEAIGPSGRLIIFEQDPSMAKKLKERFVSKNVEVIGENFRTIGHTMRSRSITSVDAVLADLGWNSEQFAEGGRGFSFQKDEPLLMTYGDPHTAPFTASDIVNTWSEESIADALYAYADERFARRIAHGIVRDRKESPITTTTQLVECVVRAVPVFYRKGRIHPATKTFQALRIAVNDEFDALREFIDESIALLKDGGRLAIISFHSIEDRIVKETFRKYAHEGVVSLVTKKPIVPQAEEISRNPRARSAHLRIAKRTL